MIARCDDCDRRSRNTISGFRYDPMKGQLKRWRCPVCGGPLRGKRRDESEAVILGAILLPSHVEESAAYQRGLRDAERGRRSHYVPADLRDPQQQAEYLEGFHQGRAQVAP